jgi:hypothetical protein
MSSFPTCQIFRPSFARESVSRIALGNRYLLRYEGDAIGQLSELVLVRANNLQIPRLVEGLGDLLCAVEPLFRHFLKENQIPAFRIGGNWRFHIEAIDRWRLRQKPGE